MHMKRVVILVVACIAMTSCGLLNLFLYSSGQSVAGGNPLAAGFAGLVPSPDNLTPTEDPGTGLYGYLNNFGTWAIPPTFKYAGDFDDDLGLAVVSISGGRCGAIDVLANTVIEFNFRSIYDVREAISAIKKGRYVGIELWPMEDSATELYGYLDHYGKWYITPQYIYATDFTDEGYAVVQFGEKQFGAIDRSNRVVIQPNFTTSYEAKNALDRLVRR